MKGEAGRIRGSFLTVELCCDANKRVGRVAG